MLLPAQGHQAAPGELPGRAPEPHRGDRRVQPHPQGLRGRRGAQARERARLLRRGQAAGRRVPPHDEIRVRQLPRLLGPGHHEAREGQGRARAGVRADVPRRRLLRLRGHGRPRGLQGALRRHHRQPLERGPRRRCREGLHARPVPEGLIGIKPRCPKRGGHAAG